MEQSNGSQNVNETDNRNYFNTEVEGTPFRQHGELNEKTGEWESFLTMGNYRVTEKMHSSDLIKTIANINWNLVMTVVGVVVEETLKMKQEELKNGN